MIEIWPFLLAGVAGVGLGVVYFGGLWLTVRRLLSARWPGLLLLASMIGRTALALFGLYLVIGARWERSLAYLAGFILARMVLIHRLRPAHLGPKGRER